MSLFIPYSPTDVITYLSTLFTIDLSSFTSFETLLITLIANIFFFIYWFIVVYFALKIINRLWERFI